MEHTLTELEKELYGMVELDIVDIMDAPILEQFLYRDVVETFVVYTYYDEDENPLYIGSSKDFYDRRYLDIDRFGEEKAALIKYTGLVFYDTEAAMKEAKKHWISYKAPMWNKRKYENLETDYNIIDDDELIVDDKKMRNYWSWHFGDVSMESWL